MRSLTPILEEGVFCLRFGSIGADVTEEMFSLTGHGGLKQLTPPMPCSMPASLSSTPVSRRNSGPIGPHRQPGAAITGPVIIGDDADDYRPASARLQPQHQGGHRRLDRCLSEPTTVASKSPTNGPNSAANRNNVGNSSRYKTELCRAFEETGHCKYGEKCQFAHGQQELRAVHRHRKYKTELCRTYHTIGFCPYGPRCHFIHNADEARAKPAPTPRPLSMSSSPTHSDSLSNSPTSSYLFWVPGDDDYHNNNNLHQHPNLEILIAGAKPTVPVEFPDFLGAPATVAAPRLPVFSRLAGDSDR